MSLDENKHLVQLFMDEVWNQMNPDAVDRFVAPGMIDHSGRGSGREAVKQAVRLFATAFPDWHTTVEDLIAEGDKVVMRGVSSGTHHGLFMGIPATGRQVTVPGIHIMRIADGKIVEHWAQGDYLGMMRQLGVVPERSG
jgi:steroid delta-isomerase-like uncharacterized protein